MDTLVLDADTKADVSANATSPIAQPDLSKEESFDVNYDVLNIMSSIPHRYPFLLIDRIVEHEPGKRIKALKNVTINEPFFNGHFPGLPIMPGVLQVEAMAQTGAYLVRQMLDDEVAADKVAVLAGLNNFRFRRVVKPGDQLIMTGELIKFRPPIGKADCKAYVDGELAVSGEIMFSIIDKALVR